MKATRMTRRPPIPPEHRPLSCGVMAVPEARKRIGGHHWRKVCAMYQDEWRAEVKAELAERAQRRWLPVPTVVFPATVPVDSTISELLNYAESRVFGDAVLRDGLLWRPL